MKQIKEIVFNDDRRNPITVRISQSNVLEIQEHQAAGEGDKWFWDIVYRNDEILRVFNPELITYDTK